LEKRFDGKIDGKDVKVIVRTRETKTIFFAKPKEFDVNTPHFEVSVEGDMTLHEDSADGNSFRVMDVASIYSGSLRIGNTFAMNKGMDMAVLPMNETANGFAINVTDAGANVQIPFGDEWCLMAYGKWGDWQLKRPKLGQTV
jgi:hypothetical protein